MRHHHRLLVALDVDGTLIHEDESIGDPVLEQVRRVRALGHEVTLATGRSWESALPILVRLGLQPEYVVCANGALTMKRDASGADGYVRFHVETFDPTEVLQTIRPHLPTGSFMVEDPSGHRRYTEGMTDWEVSNGTMVPFEQLAGRPATRVVVVSPEHGEEEFLAVVDRMGLHKVSYSIGWTAWLDIAPEGVNKATALERVRTWLGVDLTNVIAVGDGRNDVDMLSWAGAAGRGIAMGHAPDDVKAAASEVTASVTEDGVARVLESL